MADRGGDADGRRPSRVLLLLALCAVPRGGGISLSPSAKLKRMEGILSVCAHLQEQPQWDQLSADHPDLCFSQIATASIAAPSPIHGRGLFAARPLAPGEVVAFYPVHTLGDSTRSLTFIAETDAEPVDPTAYRVALPPSPGLRGWAEDMWIDSDPGVELVPGWEAHLVNEGVACAIVNEKSIAGYYEASRARANCLLLPFGDTPLMCFATVREVAQGEELLGMYGHEYWCVRADVSAEIVSEVLEAPTVVAAAAAWEDEVRMWRRQLQLNMKDEIEQLRAIFQLELELCDAESAAAESSSARPRA